MRWAVSLLSYAYCISHFVFDFCRRFLQQDFDTTVAFVNHERKQRTEVHGALFPS
jgi:hypothetical protein